MIGGGRVSVFSDQVDNGFFVGVWGGSFDLTTDTSHFGTTAIRLSTVDGVGLEANRDGLQFGFSGLELWVYGGAAGGQQLELSVESGQARVLDTTIDQLLGGPIPAGRWAKVVAPFFASTTGGDISLQVVGRDAQAGEVLLDDIALIPAAVGTCSPSAPVGTSCSDGNVCNGEEICDGEGRCLAGLPPLLDDGNACTTDSCDPQAGVLHTPASTGTSCTSGDTCQVVGTCDGAGSCVAAAAPTDLAVYQDGFQACFTDVTSGAHDPVETSVVHTGSSAVVVWGDGLSFLSESVARSYGAMELWIDASSATGGQITIAVQDSTNTVAWADVPVQGGSSWQRVTVPFEPASQPGSLWVTIFTGGAGGPVYVDDLKLLASYVNPCEGAPAGTSCSDGNACNGEEICDGFGACQAGTPPVLDDGNVCTLDSCDPELGVVHTPVAAGSACSDGNGCNGAETCNGAGTCAAGTPPVVDDGDACTADACDPVSGVYHTRIPGCGLPPDPGTVAPPNNGTAATDMASSVGFLYSGSSPIQTGVAEGTIAPERVAVVRGLVKGRDSQPISGVVVKVLNHPELGRTQTRADGMFDLVVNGGGPLTIDYQKDGYLPAQRHVDVPWRDYIWADDLVLVPFATERTEVTLGTPAIQVARGRQESDSDGQRRATILFPAGTQATMVNTDGTRTVLSAMHVRATEFTVGATGQQAMPAPLPPATAYTYAVALTVDEAVLAAAPTVEFDRPVPVYLENFLGLPAGWPVPSGYYDPQRGTWVASTDGRVVSIVSVQNGMAALDLDGDGVAESADSLATFGFTTAELQMLASTYAVGQTLWRVPVTHFTTWDFNYGWGCVADEKGGFCAAPTGGGPLFGWPKDDHPNECHGSTVECQNQILGESLPIIGTSFGIAYRSDRQFGRTAERTVTVEAPSFTPGPAKGYLLEVYVAGQRLNQKLPTTNPGSTTYVWDGRDAYGRPVQGAAPVVVRRGFQYQPVMMMSTLNGSGGNGNGPYSVLTPTVSFGSAALFDHDFTGWPYNLPQTGHFRADALFVSWTTWTGKMGAWTELPTGLGGWSLSPHHGYDPVGQVLYRGDGERQGGTPIAPRIITSLSTPAQWWATAMAMDPDGSLYTASSTVVRKYDRFGNWSVVVGGGSPCQDAATGVPAANLCVPGVTDVAVGPDGLVYFPVNQQIVRLRSDGTIEVVAGASTASCSGASISPDGTPALSACLGGPINALTVGPDRSIYFARPNVVRKITPGGFLATVAGTDAPCHDNYWGFASACSWGDGGSALRAHLNGVQALALGANGSLYIGQGAKVRRILPNGIINTVAGSSAAGYFDPWQNGTTVGFSGDGGLATQAQLSSEKLFVDRDGSLLIADSYNHRIRRVDPDGIIETIAGNGQAGSGGWTEAAGDGGPALQAQLSYPYQAIRGLDGELLIADAYHNRVRKVSAPLPGYSLVEQILASADGAELYAVDMTGRHLRTVDPLTGVVRYRFGYDTAGRLTTVTDVNGLVTTIERSGDRPTAIVGPYGQRTTLSVDANGYLSQVTNPAGETAQFTYDANGLLQQFVDPRNGVHAFQHDTFGRLLSDSNPAGGSWALARSELQDGYRVSVSTARGRTAVHDVTTAANGDRMYLDTAPDGTWTSRTEAGTGVVPAQASNGMTAQTIYSADPRFGMNAPLAAVTITTPAGLSLSSAQSVTVALQDVLNPLSVQTLTRRATVNGRTAVTSYDAALRTETATTAGGRVATRTLDDRGRTTRVALPGVLPIQFGYDAQGRPSSITQGVRTSTFDYDSLGRVRSITGPDTRTVMFTYDLANRVATETLPGNRQVSFSYDASGNVTGVTPPGKTVHGFSFTADDQVASYLPPVAPGTGLLGTSYGHDLDGAVTSATLPSAEQIATAYDTAGRLSTVSTARGTTTLGYDAAGRVGTVSWTGGELFYSYDGALPLSETSTGTISGAVGWTYDNDFRLTGTSVNGAAVGYQYDPDSLLIAAGALSIAREATTGRVSGTTLGVVGTAPSYDGYGAFSGESATGAASSYSYTLQRDLAGRITGKTETVQGTTTSYGYGYDDAGRLATVTRNGVQTASYQYDDNGNRLGQTNSAGAVTGTYDAQDRLTGLGGTAYTYGPNGDLTSKTSAGTTTAYDYDAMGNLRAANLPNGRLVEYVIDGLNRRVGKRVNGALVEGFLYEGQLRPAAWLDGSGQVYARFVYGLHANAPEYMVTAAGTFRFLTDHLGSPRLVVNASSGAVAQRIDYDEWGQVLADTNPGFQPFGFAGGLYDRDTGLLRFGARDYDPSVGRWTSKDPLGFEGGLNFYEYAANDPVNFIDPMGLAISPLNPSLVNRIIVLVMSGKMLEAHELLEAELGEVPDWFNKMQAAFSASSRVMGQCQSVAQSIADGFRRLGQSPQVINITSEGDPMARMLSWRGKELVSSGNFHQAVLLGDRVYDAYTGAQGMLWSEYQVAMEHLGTLTYTVAP